MGMCGAMGIVEQQESVGLAWHPTLTRVGGNRTYQWCQDKGHIEGRHLNAIANVVQDVTLQ